MAAVYTSIESSSILSRNLDLRTRLSVNMQVADENTYDDNMFVVPSSILGEVVGVQPPQMRHVRNVVESDSLNSPLYNRFLLVDDQVIVASVSAGATVVDGTFIFGVWNGFGNKETVASIDLSQPESISFTGLGVGTTFARYEELEVLTTILSTAPASIVCVVDIVFESGEALSFTIRGTVAIDVLFKPQNHLVEFVSFQTDVITSLNGSEQRRALRRFPRHSLAVKYKDSDREQTDKMKNGLVGRAGQLLGFPFWHMSRPTTTQPLIGDTILNVNTDHSYYQENGLCMLYGYGLVYEIRKIASFDGTTITLDEEVENDYEHCEVMPYFTMKTSTPISWTDYNNYSEFDIEGMMTEAVVVDDFVFEEYENLGVIPYECNLFKGQSIKMTSTNAFSGFDALTGKNIERALWDSSKVSNPFGIHATSREDCFNLRRIIYALRGRQKAIWVPSYSNDFVVTEDIVAGNVFTCKSNGYAKYMYGDETNYKHIALYRSGEAPEYREIVDAHEEGDTQTITVDTALPTVAMADVKVCLMARSRLSTDTVEMEWLNVDECYCNLNFLAVKE